MEDGREEEEEVEEEDDDDEDDDKYKDEDAQASTPGCRYRLMAADKFYPLCTFDLVNILNWINCEYFFENFVFLFQRIEAVLRNVLKPTD